MGRRQRPAHRSAADRPHRARCSAWRLAPTASASSPAVGDKTVRVWDADTGKAIGAPITGHTDPVSSVAFSPDGKRIASGSYDTTVRMWDAATGQPIGQPLAGPANSVFSVAFSPDGKRIASGSGDKTVRLWSADNGQPLGDPLTGHTDSVESVTFSPTASTSCPLAGTKRCGPGPRTPTPRPHCARNWPPI